MLSEKNGISNRILVIDDNADIHGDFKTILVGDVLQQCKNSSLDELEGELFGNEESSSSAVSTEIADQGYELEFASQGADGLALVEEAFANGDPFFLAFVDMRMPPGWDGLETVERLWSVDPDLQIVICTAFSDYSQQEITERLGLNENLLILKKPFDSEEVSQLASTLHQKREMARLGLLAMAQMEVLVAERTDSLARCTLKNEKSVRQLEKLTKQMEKQQDNQIQAEKLASIGQLAAGVAHEINNPVGFLTSNLGTMQEYLGIVGEMFEMYENLRAATAEGKGTVDILADIKAFDNEENISEILKDAENLLNESSTGCVRIKDIVDNLKSFARADAKAPVMADLNQGLESTLRILNNELKYKYKVIRNFGNIPLFGCFPGQMNQVFTNLVVNASHAIENEGTITVTTCQEGQNLVVKVQDTGSGIKPANLSNIFNPFFTTKPVGKGTGLGLSVSHGIVKKHGGSLTVQSELGVGSEFCITLPLPGLGVSDEDLGIEGGNTGRLDEIVIG